MSTFADIWQTVLSEFSDIADVKEATVIVLRLTLAVILGAAIGYERERRGKDAGLRTHMLVSLVRRCLFWYLWWGGCRKTPSVASCKAWFKESVFWVRVLF